MTIELAGDRLLADLATPALAADHVARLAADPRVRSAVTEAEASVARLRFHEGLRRGWEEARAEAAVREAAAVALLSGARTTVDDVRALSLVDAAASGGAGALLGRGGRAHDGGHAGTGPRDGDVRREGGDRLDPGAALALGVWRAEWEVTRRFEPLNSRTRAPRAPRPLPAVLAGIHRDMCSVLVRDGWVEARSVALPAPRALAAVAQVVAAPGPAIVRAALVSAVFRTSEVFTPASAAVGAVCARWLLVESGAEPTGVALPSAREALDPAPARAALAGIVEGGAVAGVDWVVESARGLEEGAVLGEDVALRVQAGRLG